MEKSGKTVILITYLGQSIITKTVKEESGLLLRTYFISQVCLRCWPVVSVLQHFHSLSVVDAYLLGSIELASLRLHTPCMIQISNKPPTHVWYLQRRKRTINGVRACVTGKAVTTFHFWLDPQAEGSAQSDIQHKQLKHFRTVRASFELMVLLSLTSSTKALQDWIVATSVLDGNKRQ